MRCIQHMTLTSLVEIAPGTIKLDSDRGKIVRFGFVSDVFKVTFVKLFVVYFVFTKRENKVD